MNSNKTHWLDDNENKWDKTIYDKDAALKQSLTLINCRRCINCINLLECSYCTDCNSLVNCVSLVNCYNCIDCNNCINCHNCKSCSKCIKCSGKNSIAKSIQSHSTIKEIKLVELNVIEAKYG